MEGIICLFTLLLMNLTMIVAAEVNLQFVIIYEVHDEDFPEKLTRTFRAAEKAFSEAKISDKLIALDRENEDEAGQKLCASLATGVSAILDLSWAPWDAANEVADKYGVPLVRTLLGPQQLVEALDRYFDFRNATDAALIFQDERELDQGLYQLLGHSSVRIWVHAGFDRDTAKVLRRMRPDPSFYAIIGDTSFVMEAYRRAVKEKLVRFAFRWNLVFTDYVTQERDVSQIILPTVLLEVEAEECCRLLGEDGCQCPGDIQVQKQQRVLNAFFSNIIETYLKLDQQYSAKTSAKVDCTSEGLSTLNATKELLYGVFSEDSEANNDSLLYWDETRQGLLLRSKFNLMTNRPGSGIERTAVWKASEEFHLVPGISLDVIKPFYRVGTYPAIPWTMPKLNESGHQMYTEDGEPIYEGYCIDLIQRISEVMEFDYEIITPKSGGFGQRLPNGSWDGLVGDLTRGETDIVVAALTMTAEREEVIDFVVPYFEQTGILIVIRKPIRKTSLFKFMTVLRTEVWLSIVAALIMTGFMIWILDKYSPYSARNNPGKYPYPCREFTLKESFWFALTSFTPQGGGEAPKALSGRTLVAAYWLFVVLMLATFTANLAAFLTVERMQTPVASLEQLAKQSRINYTVVEGSSVHQYFINMKFAEDTLYRVWKEITLNATSDQAQYRVWDYPIREQYGHILLAINYSGPVPDAKTGFQQVDEHTDADFAFIHDSAEIKYELTRNCNLTEVGEVFAEQPYAIAVQQGARIQEDISRALLDLQKERLMEILHAKYWNQTARSSCPDADESEGITLESLGGVFIATLFGLGLAMLTLAWEVFYYKRKDKNKVKTINVKPESTPHKTELGLNTIKSKMAFLAPNMKAKSVLKQRKKKDYQNKLKAVTIGQSFKPASERNVSYISVFPNSHLQP